ncbi:EamA family transporter [Clostridium yunnanense]|uniref:EamA family transporter n=1 Tax=Clostridium yunnanense TaxID=2800325 RepID=UPI001A9C9CB0|nr:EamA family transporter [Clostridium yunnanense]
MLQKLEKLGVIFVKFQYAPILLVILSSLCYHLFQKSMPSNLNPIAALIVTYACALAVSIVAFFIFAPKTNLIQSLGGANWASCLLGLAVVGIELGFLLAYRSGWSISSASLLSNIMVALLLIPIGLLLYKEKISLTTIAGVILCITGLILISKR